MTKKHRTVRALAAVVFPLALAACDDHGCRIGRTDYWQENDLSTVVESPERCPINVVKGQRIYFTVVSTAGYYEWVRAQPWYTRFQNNARQNVSDVYTDNWYLVQHYGRVQSSGHYYAGTTSPSCNFCPLVDYGAHWGTTNRFGPEKFPHAEAEISYQSLILSSIAGPSGPVVGLNNTWTANAQGAVPPLTYQWYRNGTLVPGATAATYSHVPAQTGALQLRRVITGQYSTEDAQRTVTAEYSVGISGPSAVAENSYARWDAGAPGGFVPVGYRWWVDGFEVGNQSYLETSLGPGGSSHEIRVRVQDANGNSAEQTRFVHVTYEGGGGTCLQPPCP